MTSRADHGLCLPARCSSPVIMGLLSTSGRFRVLRVGLVTGVCDLVADARDGVDWRGVNHPATVARPAAAALTRVLCGGHEGFTPGSSAGGAV
jgi:hypothetical protein